MTGHRRSVEWGRSGARAVLLGGVALAGAVGSSATAAQPPPGAAISDSLKYVGRVADAAGIVEGKLDSVGGRSVLVTTRTFGFKIYDLSDPEHPALLGLRRTSSSMSSSCQ